MLLSHAVLHTEDSAARQRLLCCGLELAARLKVTSPIIAAAADEVWCRQEMDALQLRLNLSMIDAATAAQAPGTQTPNAKEAA